MSRIIYTSFMIKGSGQGVLKCKISDPKYLCQEVAKNVYIDVSPLTLKIGSRSFECIIILMIFFQIVFSQGNL